MVQVFEVIGGLNEVLDDHISFMASVHCLEGVSTVVLSILVLIKQTHTLAKKCFCHTWYHESVAFWSID